MNTSELEKLLKTFNEISGMEISLADNKYHNIVSIKPSYNTYCNAIHRYQKCSEKCMECDMYYFRKLKKTNKLITYTCPFGFFTAIAPIMKDGEMIASLILAPAIEDKDGGDLLPISKAKELAPDVDVETLKHCILNIPRYSKEKLEAFTQVLMLYAKEIEERELISEDRTSIAQLIKSYIDKNLHNKITLNYLSWNLHCSTVTITEHFRKEYNTSIVQYITSQRMKRAERLLLDGNHSVSKIASMCGFPDVEYFSRTFKKYHGLSPTQWIAQNRIK